MKLCIETDLKEPDGHRMVMLSTRCHLVLHHRGSLGAVDASACGPPPYLVLAKKMRGAPSVRKMMQMSSAQKELKHGEGKTMLNAGRFG